MTIATNSNEVSSAALNAINKIADERFQQLQAIQTQFLWTTIYIYGSELLKPTTAANFVNDPRNIYVSNKEDTSYLSFADKYKVPQQFVYVNVDGKAQNTNFIAAADEMIQKCEFANIKIKDDAEKLASYVGALMYFGKWDTFKKLLGEVYNISAQMVVSTFNNYKEIIEQQEQKLSRMFKISKDDLKKFNGFVNCTGASFCSSELKKEYLETKAEYAQMLKELYNIVQGVPSLSVCYNNSSIDNVAADNEGIAYVNVKQVINCAGNEIAEETASSEDNNVITEVLKNISELKADTTIKTELINKVNKRVDDMMNNMFVKYTTGIIIIIVLVVLFIMCLAGLILSIKNKNDIKKKLQGGEVVDKYLLKYFE